MRSVILPFAVYFLLFTALNGKFCLLQIYISAKKSEGRRRQDFFTLPIQMKRSYPGTLHFSISPNFLKRHVLLAKTTHRLQTYKYVFTAGFTASTIKK